MCCNLVKDSVINILGRTIKANYQLAAISVSISCGIVNGKIFQYNIPTYCLSAILTNKYFVVVGKLRMFFGNTKDGGKFTSPILRKVFI